MQINPVTAPDFGSPLRQTAGKSENLKTEVSEDLPAQTAKPEKFSESQKVLTERDISVSFSLDDRTNEVVIKLLDDKTGEVVRQIPTEVSLRMAAAYEQWQGKFSERSKT